MESLIDRYNAAKEWIINYTVENSGIAVSSGNNKPYPEVSGYYIPTLLNWGERERALQYAEWLVSIQNEDGSWSDAVGSSPYTFDTGQILKGLLALSDIKPEYKNSMIKGCDWLIKQILPDGRLTTPDTRFWRLPNDKFVPESIHLYCLEPLKQIGEKYNIPEYSEYAQKVLNYYLEIPDLTEFDTLSHFHAYIIEALVDLGQTEKANSAMDDVLRYQNQDGGIPAYADVDWVCSTGMFQYALILYKLGRKNEADKIFNYAMNLQNPSGGFFGGYGSEDVNYFKDAEISWAVKYFLDALFYKISASFDFEVSIFPETIDEKDGRFVLLKTELEKVNPSTVLELGCGKGRFLRRLNEFYPNIKYYGIDASPEMLKSVPEPIETKVANLLNVPYSDESMDFVFSVEAFEHAIDIKNAALEAKRLLKNGGTLIIVDKNIKNLGALTISEWEQWFDKDELAELLKDCGFKSVKVMEKVPYNKQDGRTGLFLAWIAKKDD
jgi:malonyl-CoA O-methyltransferase